MHHSGAVHAHRPVETGRAVRVRRGGRRRRVVAGSAAVLASTNEHASGDIGRIVLAGNPNTGKTTLFNVLCGARAKTSNFPGTTTAVRTGRSQWSELSRPIDILDLPGVYDLHLDTPEGAIARTALHGNDTQAEDAVVIVVDACNLARNLVLVSQILPGRPPRGRGPQHERPGGAAGSRDRCGRAVSPTWCPRGSDGGHKGHRARHAAHGAADRVARSRAAASGERDARSSRWHGRKASRPM